MQRFVRSTRFSFKFPIFFCIFPIVSFVIVLTYGRRESTSSIASTISGKTASALGNAYNTQHTVSFIQRPASPLASRHSNNRYGNPFGIPFSRVKITFMAPSSAKLFLDGAYHRSTIPKESKKPTVTTITQQTIITFYSPGPVMGIFVSVQDPMGNVLSTGDSSNQWRIKSVNKSDNPEIDYYQWMIPGNKYACSWDSPVSARPPFIQEKRGYQYVWSNSKSKTEAVLLRTVAGCNNDNQKPYKESYQPHSTTIKHAQARPPTPFSYVHQTTSPLILNQPLPRRTSIIPLRIFSTVSEGIFPIHPATKNLHEIQSKKSLSNSNLRYLLNLDKSPTEQNDKKKNINNENIPTSIIPKNIRKDAQTTGVPITPISAFPPVVPIFPTPLQSARSNPRTSATLTNILGLLDKIDAKFNPESEPKDNAVALATLFRDSLSELATHRGSSVNSSKTNEDMIEVIDIIPVITESKYFSSTSSVLTSRIMKKLNNRRKTEKIDYKDAKFREKKDRYFIRREKTKPSRYKLDIEERQNRPPGAILSDCLAQKCGTRVSVRSELGIRNNVINQALDKLRMRPMFEDIYNLRSSEGGNIRVIRVRIKFNFAVFIPFQANYIERI